MAVCGPVQPERSTCLASNRSSQPRMNTSAMLLCLLLEVTALCGRVGDRALGARCGQPTSRDQLGLGDVGVGDGDGLGFGDEELGLGDGELGLGDGLRDEGCADGEADANGGTVTVTDGLVLRFALALAVGL